MKAKEVFHLLGWRPKPATYGYEIRSFDLGQDGIIQYAQWLHPRESKKGFSRESVEELRRFLSKGDTALDIGAHSGDSALPMALAVGATGCVVALEPNPYVYPVLTKNAELNPGKTRIIPLPFAAAAEDADLTFRYSDAGYCNGGRFAGISRWRHGHAFTLRVQGKDLAAFLKREYPQVVPKIRYIKVDTEGGDEMVVRSLSEIISRNKPFLRIEMYRRLSGVQKRSLFRLVCSFGYTVRRIRDESDYRGEPLSENGLDQGHQFDAFCIPIHSP